MVGDTQGEEDMHTPKTSDRMLAEYVEVRACSQFHRSASDTPQAYRIAQPQSVAASVVAWHLSARACGACVTRNA
jgi:hypothetical protein